MEPWNHASECQLLLCESWCVSSNPVIKLTSLPGQLYWVPQIAYDAWQGSRSDRTNMTSFQFVGCILQIFLLKRVDCRSGEVNLKSQTIVQLYLFMVETLLHCLIAFRDGVHNWILLSILHIPKSIRNTLKPTFITSISASRRWSRIHHSSCSNFGDHNGRLMLPLYLWGCLGPQVGNFLKWGWCLYIY